MINSAKAYEALNVGNAVARSPVGAGAITGFTEAGYPMVNRVAVVWLERRDGLLYDPLNRSEPKPKSSDMRDSGDGAVQMEKDAEPVRGPTDVEELAFSCGGILHSDGSFTFKAGPWHKFGTLLASYGNAAQPAKSSLKVSYDAEGDCLYVVCDSNEPALAHEDELGILHRHAKSDKRLVGITIPEFMEGKQPAEGAEPGSQIRRWPWSQGPSLLQRLEEEACADMLRGDQQQQQQQQGTKTKNVFNVEASAYRFDWPNLPKAKRGRRFASADDPAVSRIRRLHRNGYGVNIVPLYEGPSDTDLVLLLRDVMADLVMRARIAESFESPRLTSSDSHPDFFQFEGCTTNDGGRTWVPKESPAEEEEEGAVLDLSDGLVQKIQKYLTAFNLDIPT